MVNDHGGRRPDKAGSPPALECLYAGLTRTRPQLERGALGSVVIAGRVKMKL